MSDIGYYSAKHASEGGYQIYETSDGRRVDVTGVWNGKGENMYCWEDAILIGPVTKFISKCGPIPLEQDTYTHFPYIEAYLLSASDLSKISAEAKITVPNNSSVD